MPNADATTPSGYELAGLLIVIAAGLVLVGYAFEIALVPFHFWAPDAYARGCTNFSASIPWQGRGSIVSHARR